MKRFDSNYNLNQRKTSMVNNLSGPNMKLLFTKLGDISSFEFSFVAYLETAWHQDAR